MRQVFIILVMFLLMTAYPIAFASPTINGSTGMINCPTADVLRPGQFAVGYYKFDGGKTGIVDFHLAKNVELGVARFDYDNGSNQSIVNAKFSLISERVLRPGIAIGVEDIGNKMDRSVYGVVSKVLPLGFRIHAGVKSGRFNGTFAGLEKTIKPLAGAGSINYFPTTTLLAEYDGRHMNYGARIAVIPGLKVNTGWRNGSYFVGLSYTY